MTGLDRPAEGSGAGQDSGPAAASRLVLAPSLCVEEVNDAGVTIHLRSSGARVRIPRALHDLLMTFEHPKGLDALAALGPRGERAIAAIDSLRARGFLIREGEPALTARRPTTDPPVRLFDCPAQKLGPAQADVIALGVPYDFAQRSAAGARHGPLAIRDTALQLLYMPAPLTGRPQGWFDADRGRSILRGVSIADCGDVVVDPGEPQADVFGRVRDVLRQVLAADTLPVLLGGDASIGFPAVDCLQSREPIAVVRIGHVAEDRGPPSSGFLTPASFAQRSLALPGVTRHVHIGDHPAGDDAVWARGLDFVRLPAEEVKRAGIAALASRLSPGQPVYLGLDLGIVDTVGEDGGDRPARLDYAEAHALLCAIGATCSIRGLDLVGLNPTRPCWGVAAMTALHLLVTAISAAKDHDVLS
jgi:agmatinase